MSRISTWFQNKDDPVIQLTAHKYKVNDELNNIIYICCKCKYMESCKVFLRHHRREHCCREMKNKDNDNRCRKHDLC